MEKLYKKKEISGNELILIYIVSSILGLPILFMPKFLIVIWFIFWVGVVMLKVEQFEEVEGLKK